MKSENTVLNFLKLIPKRVQLHLKPSPFTLTLTSLLCFELKL
jgi:hypothetical protein